MADYDDYIKAGLLTDDSRANAGWAALANLSSQLLNRGAMRLSPTPPPMDLAGVMKSYNDSIQGDLSRNLALHKFNRAEEEYKNKKTYEQNLRKAFDPVLRPITNTQTELDDDGEITGENTTTSYGLFESPLLQSIPPGLREIARTSGFGGFAPDILKELVKQHIGRKSSAYKPYIVPDGEGQTQVVQLNTTGVRHYKENLGIEPQPWYKPPSETRRNQQATFLDRKTGKYISAIFDTSHTGPEGLGYFYKNEKGEKVPVPSHFEPVTKGAVAKTMSSHENLIKQDKEIGELERGLGKIINYMQGQGDTSTGFARIADELSLKFRTLMDRGLTTKQLRLAIAKGQLQGLVGAFRIETVGGGVMTEQDALRVITNLGGDVNALQNKEVLAAQLERLYSEKMARYKVAVEQRNNMLKLTPKLATTYEPREMKKFDENVFTTKKIMKFDPKTGQVQ